MKETGMKINNMVKVKKNGHMELFMKEILQREKNKEKEKFGIYKKFHNIQVHRWKYI